MPAPTAISCGKLSRLIGTPQAPIIVDARLPSAPLTNFIPAAVQLDVFNCRDAAGLPMGSPIIVYCEDGGARSQGVAAVLRAQGVGAEVLEGGVAEWVREGFPLVMAGRLPQRNNRGQTVWVTRARPKVDRVACPWLLRRFVDPFAQFLFVPPAEVESVADQVSGAAFDIESENAFWTHRGDLCTFDVMIDEFGLACVPGLKHLAVLVRGADTARPDLAHVRR
jgi:rhodanese-related sulfurtransferase